MRCSAFYCTLLPCLLPNLTCCKMLCFAVAEVKGRFNVIGIYQSKTKFHQILVIIIICFYIIRLPKKFFLLLFLPGGQKE